MKAAVERLLAYESLAGKAGDWEPPADELRVKSFGAAMAVWIENTVKPEVKVLESDINRYYVAHPEKYLRRLRAQVRYIFIATNFGRRYGRQLHRRPPPRWKRATNLEAVASQIQDGKIRLCRGGAQALAGSLGGGGRIAAAILQRRLLQRIRQSDLPARQARQGQSGLRGSGGILPAAARADLAAPEHSARRSARGHPPDAEPGARAPLLQITKSPT